MRPEQSLDTKLDAYKALSGDDGIAGKARRRSWAVYATAAGSSMALATSAEAGIIHGTVNQTATISGTLGSANVNFVVDGANYDLFVKQYKTTSGGHAGSVGLKGAGYAAVVTTGRGLLKRFSSGQKISAIVGPPPPQGYLKQQSTSTNRGLFAAGQPGFAGIEFAAGVDIFLGWVDLKWNAGANGYPNSVTVIDWAYNNSLPPGSGVGDPINAGDTGAVPEPSSAVLALIATGAAGVLALRSQRRKAEQARALASS
jgi:hypothetical protein